MKVLVKLFEGAKKLEIIDKGDWIDLAANEDVIGHAPKINKNKEVEFDVKMFNLGIAMKLPKGLEAIVVPRSSVYKHYKCILPNSAGIIDNSYSGSNDEWKFIALFLGNSTIKKGDRVCQFKITLSQKATIWQKIKWFFSNKIEFVYVNDLDDKDRNGIGSTGKQ